MSERSDDEVIMGRRWSFDDMSESDDFPCFAFTDHRDDDVKFVLEECDSETAELVMKALNLLDELQRHKPANRDDRYNENEQALLSFLEEAWAG